MGPAPAPSRLQSAYNLCKKIVLLVLPFVNTARVGAFLRREAATHGVVLTDPYEVGYQAAIEDLAELLHIKL